MLKNGRYWNKYLFLRRACPFFRKVVVWRSKSAYSVVELSLNLVVVVVRFSSTLALVPWHDVRYLAEFHRLASRFGPLDFLCSLVLLLVLFKKEAKFAKHCLWCWNVTCVWSFRILYFLALGIPGVENHFFWPVLHQKSRSFQPAATVESKGHLSFSLCQHWSACSEALI